jgi:hypothetical protein
MSSAQAASLLTGRLNLRPEEARAHADLLNRLAAGMDYWPLALELAVGYLRTCGYTVADIPYYLEKLKLRSLDDRASIPDGYPATLIAAIDLAAGQLKAPGTDTALLDLVANMVMEAAYLSARRIPVHLLVAAALLDLDPPPGDRGPIIFEDPRIQEAVRSLRRVSFARLDQPLPRRESDLATAEHTISVNSVLQEVMRSRAENHPEFQEWKSNLDRLALHLNHWLASAAHNGEADKAHLLVPHADTLVHHLQRLDMTSGSVPLLIGNLADIYTATNDLETAIGLLKTQVQFLLSLETPDEFLVQQARLHLAQALVASEQIDTARATEVAENLEHICHVQPASRGRRRYSRGRVTLFSPQLGHP